MADPRWPNWPGKVTAHTQYEGWRPYCLVCPTMERMAEKPFGYECVACANQINPDMTHYFGQQGFRPPNTLGGS